MRVLHCAYFRNLEVGVLQQMTWEQEAAQALGLRWDARIYCDQVGEHPNPIVVRHNVSNGRRKSLSLKSKWTNWIRSMRAYFGWVIGASREYDVIVLRYVMYDPYQRSLIVRLRSGGKHVLLVHHTKEGDQLQLSHSCTSFLKGAAEYLLAPATLRAASGLVSVTREIHDYEAHRARREYRPIIYPNGISSDEVVCADERGEVPALLFVASKFHKWHGLDLVLDAFALSTANCTLHLIGELGSADAARAREDPRIRTYGKLHAAEIKNVANSCCVALSSFALRRKGMSEACPLKVREYLAMGIPVYSGHVDVFAGDFPFFRYGAPNLDDILTFAKSMADVSRQTVHDAAIPLIAKQVLLRRLYDEITSLPAA